MEITCDVKLMERVVGIDKIDPIKQGEPLVASVGTATTIGAVTSTKPLKLKLKRPVCAEKGGKVALSRRIGNRWRLIGYGIIQ